MPLWQKADLGKPDNKQLDEVLPSENESIALSLGRLLRSRLDNTGLPKLDEAAEIVGVSERTIRRHLFNEGTNYRAVLDRIRFTTAREMLRNSDVSVTEIAFQLGYSGPNNFIRSFKRISGITPNEFRHHA